MVPLIDVIMAAIRLVLDVAGREIQIDTDLTERPFGMGPNERVEIEMMVDCELDLDIDLDELPAEIDRGWRTPYALRELFKRAIEQTCWEPKQEEVTG